MCKFFLFGFLCNEDFVTLYMHDRVSGYRILNNFSFFPTFLYKSTKNDHAYVKESREHRELLYTHVIEIN